MMKKKWLALLMLAVLCLTAVCARADSELIYGVKDSKTYSGSWKSAYGRILNDHAAGIFAYQDRTISFTMNGVDYNLPCKPIALCELTGDRIPELLILWMSDDRTRGNLSVYTSDDSSAKCILQIQGVTQPGAYEEQGFNLYRAGSGKLALDFWDYETPYYVQYVLTTTGEYAPLMWLSVDYDHSGEGSDTYWWNGSVISESEYIEVFNTYQNEKTRLISGFYAEDYSYYGLGMTWDEAVSSLGSGSSAVTAAPKTSYGEIWGLTIDKLATRTGPGTLYDGGGTYSVKGQWIKVLAKAWDSRNSIWWVQCEIPYHGEIRVLWTGYKRFDSSTLPLESIPEDTSW